MNSRKQILKLLLLAFLLQAPFLLFAQKDTTQKSMSFDFGITRDDNINLWPIYKRTKTSYEFDKQFIFPFYQNYKNLRLKESSSRLIPFVWKDSSQYYQNLRILSIYYPSVFHRSINSKENSKTFTFFEIVPHVNILEFKNSSDGLIMQNNLLFFLWYQNNLKTKRSYFVVFPAYWQFKNPKRSSHTLIPLYSYGEYLSGKGHYKAITPLYWNFHTSARNSNLLFPIWWNRNIKTSNDSISSKFLAPIYYSHRDKYSQNNILLPIIWSLKNARYNSLTVAPLFSVGHNRDTSRSHLVISPLFWYIKNYEGQSTTFFPIVWSQKWKTKYEDYSTFVLFPIYWSNRENKNIKRIIPPIIWINKTPTYSSFTIIPLISKGRSPNNDNEHLIITPIFWRYKSIDAVSNTLIPFWRYKRSGELNDAWVNNFIFPLYYSWKRSDNKGNILFPIIWNFKNPNYHTFTFLPVTSVGKSADGYSSYAAITPLYWRFKTKEGSGQLLFPFWWQNNRLQDGKVVGSSKVFFLFWRYSDTERKHSGFFPLAWNLRNSNSQSFTLFPLYSYGKNKNMETSYLTVTPLFWHFRNPSRSFNTIFPLWWNKNEYSGKITDRFNLILPLYFSKSDSITIKRVVFPIVWRFKNYNYNSFTFVPLFSYGKGINSDRRHLAISPLFWHFENEVGRSTTLLPIFWHSQYGFDDDKSTNTVIFPIVWSGDGADYNNLIIFPLVWSFDNSQYKSLTFAPLFSFGSNDDKSVKHTIITPLFYTFRNSKRKSTILLPLWWNIKNRNNIDHTNILFPIYWSLKTKEKQTSIIFPVSWQFKSSKSKSYTLFPLFSFGKGKRGNAYLSVTPLFWKFDNRFNHRRLLIPLFTSYNDTLNRKKFDLLFMLYRRDVTPNSSSVSVLWPIIKRDKATDYKYFRFAPLIWSKKSPDFSYFTIQPFYYHSFSKEKSTSRLLWELFVHQNQFNIKKSNSILWKVANWDKYTNGDKEFRILYLLYCNSKIEGNIEKSVFPFYYLNAEKNGNRSLSVMLYFYNSIKRHIPNTKEYYQEDRIFWLIRIRSNYRVLKQKGIKVESIE